MGAIGWGQRPSGSTYWAVVGAQRLTTGRPVTVRPELSVINWVLPDPPNHASGVYSRAPSPSGSGL